MEIRKDYILERYVYYTPERSKRLKQYEKKEMVKSKNCFFCSGNENMTPPEIGRVEKNGEWIIRWFPNKFPVVQLKKGKRSVSKFFSKEPAFGEHNIIVETQKHDKQLWDLSVSHIKKVLEVYKSEYVRLSKVKGINYVQIFKNHGGGGGASLVHSHTQITSLSRVPSLILDKASAAGKYRSCPYCSIIKKEAKSKRKCFENKSFLTFAPYASRFNYEVWIFPKRHVRNFTELSDTEIADLADILKKVLVKLKSFNFSYNYFLHSSPDKHDLHFHIEVCPRIATWAGFELSTGMIINSVLPEVAAKFYRS